ncbi:hypothetical protein WR25_24256 [Diploscapter pachys]|uniref:Uncharacterized protein n=1 Tax=Diploscapter pachys TaxID=2018661 RepID=A0A2A2LJZ8_9BILA|nr:hypothetical protein WR25_24256 [Diploscapter pachys]
MEECSRTDWTTLNEQECRNVMARLNHPWLLNHSEFHKRYPLDFFLVRHVRLCWMGREMQLLRHTEMGAAYNSILKVMLLNETRKIWEEYKNGNRPYGQRPLSSAALASNSGCNDFKSQCTRYALSKTQYTLHSQLDGTEIILI